MEIVCASCRAPVPAQDVNLDRLIAKCARCNRVFHFEVPRGPSAVARERRLVPMPSNITILADERPQAVTAYRENAAPGIRAVFERRWFSPRYFFLAFFCLFWDGFLVMWYGNTVSSGHLGALVFPLLHVAVGIMITYTTLCGFVNRTRVAVEGGLLAIQHRPLPWLGNRRIAVDDLEQLFCEEQVGSKGSRTYDLNAILKSGEKLNLLAGLPEADQVLYLERALEERLGMVDRPVAGELV